MKKILSLVTVLFLLGSILSGCSNSPKENDNKNEIFDVVVVGSGGAGLTAAVEAHNAGQSVVVLEKMLMIGGNTIRATGGMNATGTKQQEALGIEDDVETFIEDTMKGGRNINDPELVRVLAENSASAIDWLTELGADLSDVGSSGGATNNRFHRPTGGAKVGDHVVNVLKNTIDDLGIEIRTTNNVTEILVDENNVITGVVVENSTGTYTIDTKSVILATGGFGANEDMFSSYNSSLKGYVTTNQPGALGEGIKLAQAIGADVVDMVEIQTHPTVVQSNGEMITEAVRGNGAILVNASGSRFTNEMGTRDVVSQAILEQDGQKAYLVFNDAMRETLSAIESYFDQGLVTECDTIENLATEIGFDVEKLTETIDVYNDVIVGSATDPFGRSTGIPNDYNFSEGNWYAIEVAPGVHHTMGGLKINTNAEVLNTQGAPISGLFAAGEVTGGVHGGNRLGGNAMADIIVFGRIAANSASEYNKSK